jgi:hypothetical protein
MPAMPRPFGAAHQAPDVVLLTPVGHVRPPPPQSYRMRQPGRRTLKCCKSHPYGTCFPCWRAAGGRLCHRRLQPIQLLLFGAGAFAGRLAAFRLLASAFAAGPLVGHALTPSPQSPAEPVPAGTENPSRRRPKESGQVIRRTSTVRMALCTVTSGGSATEQHGEVGSALASRDAKADDRECRVEQDVPKAAAFSRATGSRTSRAACAACSLSHRLIPINLPWVGSTSRWALLNPGCCFSTGRTRSRK